jgi:hypothetical protein
VRKEGVRKEGASIKLLRAPGSKVRQQRVDIPRRDGTDDRAKGMSGRNYRSNSGEAGQ